MPVALSGCAIANAAIDLNGVPESGTDDGNTALPAADKSCIKALPSEKARLSLDWSPERTALCS